MNNDYLSYAEIDALISPMERFIGDKNKSAQIIPLDKFHSDDWIEYGLMSRDFHSYFTSHCTGETLQYKWDYRRMDDIFNLRIWRI